MSESLDLVTLESTTEDNLGEAGAQNARAQTFVIQRIDFIGNPARSKRHPESAYSSAAKATLIMKRRCGVDFQALWNTQFFEEVN